MHTRQSSLTSNAYNLGDRVLVKVPGYRWWGATVSFLFPRIKFCMSDHCLYRLYRSMQLPLFQKGANIRHSLFDVMMDTCRPHFITLLLTELGPGRVWRSPNSLMLMKENWVGKPKRTKRSTRTMGRKKAKPLEQAEHECSPSPGASCYSSGRSR